MYKFMCINITLIENYTDLNLDKQFKKSNISRFRLRLHVFD